MNTSVYLKENIKSFDTNIEYQKLVKAYSDYMSVYFVDPATIATIASTAIKIADFIKSGERDSAFDEIRREINHAISLINEVIDILKDIKVLIKEEVRNFVINNLKGSMDSIVDNYEDWKVNLNTEKKAQILIHITNAYVNLLSYSRLAFYYGYTHYDSMAFAFNCEIFLAELLEKEKSTLKNTTIRYIDYFTQAISYNIKGSLSFSQKEIVENMTNLKNSYQPQTIKIGKTTKGGGLTTHFYDVYLKIEGSIENEFIFSEYEIFTGSYKEPGGRHLAGFESGNIYSKGDDIKNSYRNANNLYLNELIPSLKVINSSIESCKQYIKMILDYSDAKEL